MVVSPFVMTAWYRGVALELTCLDRSEAMLALARDAATAFDTVPGGG